MESGKAGEDHMTAVGPLEGSTVKGGVKTPPFAILKMASEFFTNHFKYIYQRK